MTFKIEKNHSDNYPCWMRMWTWYFKKINLGSITIQRSNKKAPIDFARLEIAKCRLGFTKDFCPQQYDKGIHLFFNLFIGFNLGFCRTPRYTLVLDEYLSHIQLGWFFIKLRTPKCLQKRIAKAKAEAAKTDCPQCGKRSLIHGEGFAGEPLETCEKCNYHWSADPRPYCE